MKKLSANWFAEGLIDFEYKQYVLLAYLQAVHKHFDDQLLYPALSEVVFHYNNLLQFQASKKALHDQLVSRMLPMSTTEPVENLLAEDHVMLELDAIVDFALPQLQQSVEQGKLIYESVEHQLFWTPIGLLPIYKKEGYLFIQTGNRHDIHVFQYAINLVTHESETYSGIHTQYITCLQHSLGTTFEHMKLQLIRDYQELPNPATYLLESKRIYPILETLLPIAKRQLMAIVSRAS